VVVEVLQLEEEVVEIQQLVVVEVLQLAGEVV
jgi:hypothetical protein